jgi:hypothetical protein
MPPGVRLFHHQDSIWNPYVKLSLLAVSSRGRARTVPNDSARFNLCHCAREASDDLNAE